MEEAHIRRATVLGGSCRGDDCPGEGRLSHLLERIILSASILLRKNEETRLEAFEMKGLRQILCVSWTAKKTNEWVLNKAGGKRELAVKARKIAYYGHTMRKQGNCLEKEIMLGTMPGVRRRGRPRTAWIDNIKSWTGLSVKVRPWCGQPSDRGRLRNRNRTYCLSMASGDNVNVITLQTQFSRDRVLVSSLQKLRCTALR